MVEQEQHKLKQAAVRDDFKMTFAVCVCLSCRLRLVLRCSRSPHNTSALNFSQTGSEDHLGFTALLNQPGLWSKLNLIFPLISSRIPGNKRCKGCRRLGWAGVGWGGCGSPCSSDGSMNSAGAASLTEALTAAPHSRAGKEQVM